MLLKMDTDQAVIILVQDRGRAGHREETTGTILIAKMALGAVVQHLIAVLAPASQGHMNPKHHESKSMED